ncbi:MAG TPA: PDZ domain-containing protein, partial [Gemmatimonadaceae bacterium]|nr:PDZ domain-containing protein [Gemmatimonadaceae bacterium]
GESSPALLITNPASAWGRAGLHTNDRLVAVNGRPIANPRELRSTLAAVRIGDTVRVDVRRPNGAFRAAVVVGGYEYPRVRLEELPAATPRQRERRQRWMAGSP